MQFEAYLRTLGVVFESEGESGATDVVHQSIADEAGGILHQQLCTLHWALDARGITMHWFLSVCDTAPCVRVLVRRPMEYDARCGVVPLRAQSADIEIPADHVAGVSVEALADHIETVLDS